MDIFAENKKLVAIDSRGYFFARNANLLYRSIDNGATWTSVLTMASGSQILSDGWAEDKTGVLYAGQYQVAESAIVYKSTDYGATWVESWSDPNRQHIHGIAVPYTGWVYAGVDDGTLTKSL